MTDPTARPTAGPTCGPALLVARGARAAEAALLREVRAHVEAARAEPRLLARPVRIVVPSRSLREHVAATIARELGTVAGVVVQTLQALARDVLERTGAASGEGDDLFPLLVRREAARLAVLRGALGALEDGYASVIGAIADFLDAGLTPELAPPVADRIAALPTDLVGDGERERAVALVAVAARVWEALRTRRLARRSDRLARAAEGMRDAAGDALVARAVLVHGFAEATGVALALIERLCRDHAAVVVLDLPPDPSPGGDGGASERFTRRLFERVRGGVEAPVETPPAVEAACELVLLDAVGADAEVRGVADRIRTLLDADPTLAPERIGVVARHLDAYAMPLRRHLDRLAIPFSSNAKGPAGALARRLHALLRLLREGGGASVDAWLDARDLAPGLRADLRVAFHALGAGRLAEVARLDVKPLVGDGSGLALPVRHGLSGGAPPSDPPNPPQAELPPRAPYAEPRRVSRAQLEAAVAGAAAVEGALAGGEGATLAQHVAALRDRVAPELGLRPRRPGDPRRVASATAGAVLHDELAGIARALPADERLSREEWLWLLEQRLERRVAAAVGGAGAGVQTLDVVAARGRTFSHLFVLGMNRDLFPRTVATDPLLPDALRAALRDVLSDLPVKEEGYDEERHLFAQLLSSSPRVTLSWQVAGDDGKARSPSPLVERLRWGCHELVPARLPALYAPDARRTPRPAFEHAILAGLRGGGRALAPVLPSALAATHQRVPSELAHARLAVLRELDRYGKETEPLGPYFGTIGAVLDRSDPRRRPLHVTAAEGIATCGWRHLLERLLGIEPAPDATSALPGVEPRLVGQVVHRALDEIARASGATASELAEALAAEGVAMQWPDAAGLHALALDVSVRVLEEEGPLVLPGLARAVAAKAAGALAVAAAADLAAGARVIGSELRGSCILPGTDPPRTLHFRADRAERQGDTIVLTDFKTGSLLTDAVTEDKRVLAHLRGVLRGTNLQPTAYALGAAAPGRPAAGRYLYVRAKDDAASELRVESDDDRFKIAFARAVAVVSAAREQGSLVPRVVDAAGDEPKICERCAVAEACVRGDSGLRARLRRWSLARAGGPVPDDTAAERALRDLWWLAEEDPA